MAPAQGWHAQIEKCKQFFFKQKSSLEEKSTSQAANSECWRRQEWWAWHNMQRSVAWCWMKKCVCVCQSCIFPDYLRTRTTLTASSSRSPYRYVLTRMCLYYVLYHIHTIHKLRFFRWFDLPDCFEHILELIAYVGCCKLHEYTHTDPMQSHCSSENRWYQCYPTGFVEKHSTCLSSLDIGSERPEEWTNQGITVYFFISIC